MSVRQKFCIIVSLLLILLVLMLDHIYPDELLVRILKFLIIAALLIQALLIEKKYSVQKTMNVALFFAAIGDFIFLLCKCLLIKDYYFIYYISAALGGFFFILSYLYLIKAFKKSFTLYHFLSAALLAGITSKLLIKYYCFINVITLAGLIIFGVILCFMTCSSICTIFEGYYKVTPALCIGIAGILIYISDICVGISVFVPSNFEQFRPWLNNAIWGSFISAWAIITILIAEDNLIYE